MNKKEIEKKKEIIIKKEIEKMNRKGKEKENQKGKNRKNEQERKGKENQKGKKRKKWPNFQPKLQKIRGPRDGVFAWESGGRFVDFRPIIPRAQAAG
jgi:hypothetical protein